MDDGMKARIITCGALMSLWLAMVVAQADVVAEALAGPPALTDLALWLGIACVIPHIPGLLVLGVVCALFRNACYTGRPLGTHEASAAVVLIGDAIFYFAITYWIAKGILRRRAKGLQTDLVMGATFALLANGVLTGWMVWVKKPYYVRSTPGFSVCSLMLGVLTILSAFWPVRPRNDLARS
jgi:hypothetical protein